MKKLVLVVSVLVFVLCVTCAFAGRHKEVPFESLPAASQTFVKQHFANVAVSYAEAEKGGFDVRLADGTKIEFFANGEWEEIESRGAGLPLEVLPQAIAATVKNDFPQNSVVKIERERYGYDVKLDNRTKLLFDTNGVLTGKR